MSEGIITRRASDIRPLLLDRFRNAAAAYSLRPLTLSGQDNPVVKVRRSVDDTEQDFNPAQINDGTLEQFVNAGDVAPADYGTGAAAAYSLRYVSDGYTGDVVRVRRSVDNTEQDFNPTEIEDGTLTDWVTASDDASEMITNGTFDTDLTGWTDFQGTSTWNADGTVTVTRVLNSNDNLYQAITTVVGQSYLVSGTMFLSAGGSAGIHAATSTNPNFGINVLNSVLTTETTPQNVSFIFTATTTTTYIGLDEAGTYDNISVKEASSGLVTTWYDQSGNSNDATQATAASQPKIVSGGSLVTENGKPALDFDGSDDFLELLNTATDGSNPLDINDDLFCSIVLTPTNNSSAYIFNNYEGTGTYDGQHILFHQDPLNTGVSFESSYDDDANPSTLTGLEQTINEKHLFTSIRNKGGTNYIYVDGVENTSGSDTLTGDVISNRNWVIGRRSESSVEIWQGLMSEIILYDSDQSSNRELIETNVNHYYSIYSQTNDGFVTTWYDQSGNGNDATQSTAASQPKIVSAGSLVVENGKAALDFDGVDDVLVATGGVISSVEVSVFVKITIDDYRTSAPFFHTIVSQGIHSTQDFGCYVADGSTELYSDVFISDSQTTRLEHDSGAEQLGETILSFIGKNSFQQISKDGSVLATATESGFNAGGTQDLFIGDDTDSRTFIGNIQEVVLYGADQSSIRQQIESNINNHYGIY